MYNNNEEYEWIFLSMWDEVVQLTNACTVERKDSRGAAAPRDLVDFRVAIRMMTGRSTGEACSYIRLGVENAREPRAHSGRLCA